MKHAATRTRVYATLLILMFLVSSRSVSATEQVNLCVSTSSDDSFKKSELDAMTRAILGNFPGFQIVETECDTTLEVAIFKFAGQFALTLRTGDSVPLRYTCENGHDIQFRLETGIPEVLRADPVYLQKNITEYSRAAKLSHAIVVTGHNIFRLELMETITRGEHGASFAPGGAFAFTRGSRMIRVFGRIYGCGAPVDAPENQSQLELSVGLDAGATVEFSQSAPATFYLSGGFGIAFQRFEGVFDLQRYSTNDVVAQLLLRTGVRVLRLTDFDLDLFAAGYLPVHPISDLDTPMFGSDQKTWTPSVQLGLGVGF